MASQSTQRKVGFSSIFLMVLVLVHELQQRSSLRQAGQQFLDCVWFKAILKLKNYDTIDMTMWLLYVILAWTAGAKKLFAHKHQTLYKHPTLSFFISGSLSNKDFGDWFRGARFCSGPDFTSIRAGSSGKTQRLGRSADLGNWLQPSVGSSDLIGNKDELDI